MGYNFAVGFYRVRIKKGYKTQKEFINSFNDYFNLQENEEHYLKTDTVSNWERGKTMPRGETLIKLCDFFNCDMDYLFGGTEFINKDVQHIHEYTGLTTQAIEKLYELNAIVDDDEKIINSKFLEIYSSLIIHPDFKVAISALRVENYLKSTNLEKEYYIFIANRCIQNVLTDILDIEKSNEIDNNSSKRQKGGNKNGNNN